MAQNLRLAFSETDRLLIGATGLYHIIYTPKSWENLDMLTALAKRWHSEMSTFHLPIGEMTVTLEDVYRILRLPIIGELVQYDRRGGLTECRAIFGDDEIDETEISWEDMVDFYEPLSIVLAGAIRGYVCPDWRSHGFVVGWGQTL